MQQCQTHDTQHVRKFVLFAKRTLNDARYYPPLHAHRYMVALAIYSKCLTVAEATLALVEAGFGDEAFGLTRTMVDNFITLRYIANKDTEERARLYWQFYAKDVEAWNLAIASYWPQKTEALDPRTRQLALNYHSPHKWSGKSVRDMALEPDTVEVDSAGRPFVHDFAYHVIYRWTSHYVHPTIVSLTNHLVQAGRDSFVVRSGFNPNSSNLAIFNTASYVTNTMICFYRCMGTPQPVRLGNWAGALIRHLSKRHDPASKAP